MKPDLFFHPGRAGSSGLASRPPRPTTTCLLLSAARQCRGKYTVTPLVQLTQRTCLQVTSAAANKVTVTELPETLTHARSHVARTRGSGLDLSSVLPASRHRVRFGEKKIILLESRSWIAPNLFFFETFLNSALENRISLPALIRDPLNLLTTCAHSRCLRPYSSPNKLYKTKNKIMMPWRL